MTRVQQDHPITIIGYDNLDTANKKRNLFIRATEKLEISVNAMVMAEKALNEANQKIEAANKQCFQGNEELRALKEELEEEKKKSDMHPFLSAQAATAVRTLKSKWYFKLFGAWNS